MITCPSTVVDLQKNTNAEASITILYQPTSAAVKAAAAAVSAALGGAIGASVGGAAAGAAAGAAGGSAGSSSGSSTSGGSANLLGMVGFAQVFVTTSQMSASGLSPEYKDMSSSLSWVMLDVKMPFVKGGSSSSQNGTGNSTANSTSSATGRRRLYDSIQEEWGLEGRRHQVFVLGPRGSAAFLSVEQLGSPAEMDPRRRRLQDSSSTQPGLDQLQGVSFASEVGNQLSFANGAVVGAANAVPKAAATFAAAQAQATALQQSVASKFNLSPDPYVRVQEVVFIVWLAALAVTLVQTLLVYLLKRQGLKVPATLLFPKPQLMLALFLFPTVAGAAAGCFKDGSRQAIMVGVILLLSLPVPLLIYILYIPVRQIMIPHAYLRRLFYEARYSFFFFS